MYNLTNNNSNRRLNGKGNKHNNEWTRLDLSKPISLAFEIAIIAGKGRNRVRIGKVWATRSTDRRQHARWRIEVAVNFVKHEPARSLNVDSSILPNNQSTGDTCPCSSRSHQASTRHGRWGRPHRSRFLPKSTTISSSGNPVSLQKQFLWSVHLLRYTITSLVCKYSNNIVHNYRSFKR